MVMFIKRGVLDLQRVSTFLFQPVLPIVFVLLVSSSLASPIHSIEGKQDSNLDVEKLTFVQQSAPTNYLKHEMSLIPQNLAHSSIPAAKRKSRQYNNMPFIIYGGCSPYRSNVGQRGIPGFNTNPIDLNNPIISINPLMNWGK
ncbi:uncharacterized protein LOC110855016 isoform X2 [Folsomia candida]|uniref:Uncharacterized protein n=1 Tax=Folsomia candida TaxID=158441 RepID=A0A226DY12_FOLCA|nr:uncharacterized protein LOC110855016 isoform X2 [Folsomia candida]OXA49106.1 hypothetical protein Fcan01_16228 [Folsomia candida]